MSDKPENKPLTPNQVKILFPLFEQVIIENHRLASWPPVNIATLVLLQMRDHPVLKHVKFQLYEVETAAIAFLNFRQ